jgi:hypothetical protein
MTPERGWARPVLPFQARRLLRNRHLIGGGVHAPSRGLWPAFSNPGQSFSQGRLVEVETGLQQRADQLRRRWNQADVASFQDDPQGAEKLKAVSPCTVAGGRIVHDDSASRPLESQGEHR